MYKYIDGNVYVHTWKLINTYMEMNKYIHGNV